MKKVQSKMTRVHAPCGHWVSAIGSQRSQQEQPTPGGPQQRCLEVRALVSFASWGLALWEVFLEQYWCGRAQESYTLQCSLVTVESEKLEMENALRSLGPFPNCLKVAPYNVFFIALSSQLPPFPWGGPFHVVIDLVVRKIFLMFSLNFPWLTFIPLLQLKPPSQLLTSLHLRPFSSIRGNKWVWSSKALCL